MIKGRSGGIITNNFMMYSLCIFSGFHPASASVPFSLIGRDASIHSQRTAHAG